MRRVRRAWQRWRERQYRHRHESGLVHAHRWPMIDHDHTFDANCGRSECRPFALHRYHPRPVEVQR